MWEFMKKSWVPEKWKQDISPLQLLFKIFSKTYNDHNFSNQKRSIEVEEMVKLHNQTCAKIGEQEQ